MLKSQRKRLHDLGEEEFFDIAEQVCHNHIEAFPVFECVKVFCRLTESGDMTYARHANDLGTLTITAEDIASRMKSPERESVVLEALRSLESANFPWPFSPGSSSWVQLEILDPSIRMKGPVNTPQIVFRRAVRLSTSRSEDTVTSSPLVERMFATLEKELPEVAGRFKLTFAPCLRLKNVAGLGIMSEALKVRDELSVSELAESLVSSVLLENSQLPLSMNPGLFIRSSGEEYRVVSDCYYAVEKQEPASKESLPPLPIGFVR